jgi:hypothetical protein
LIIKPTNYLVTPIPNGSSKYSHFQFMDFTKFRVSNPTLLNIVICLTY